MWSLKKNYWIPRSWLKANWMTKNGLKMLLKRRWFWYVWKQILRKKLLIQRQKLLELKLKNPTLVNKILPGGMTLNAKIVALTKKLSGTFLAIKKPLIKGEKKLKKILSKKWFKKNSLNAITMSKIVKRKFLKIAMIKGSLNVKWLKRKGLKKTLRKKWFKKKSLTAITMSKIVKKKFLKIAMKKASLKVKWLKRKGLKKTLRKIVKKKMLKKVLKKISLKKKVMKKILLKKWFKKKSLTAITMSKIVKKT